MRTPRDFVIKLGQKLFAFDDQLDPLWNYDIPSQWQEYGRQSAYIPAVGDIDGEFLYCVASPGKPSSTENR